MKSRPYKGICVVHCPVEAGDDHSVCGSYMFQPVGQNDAETVLFDPEFFFDGYGGLRPDDVLCAVCALMNMVTQND
jgi:hypothetical protein